MHRQFQVQMQEFQKEQEALKQISEANKRMERSKLEREKNAKMLDEELDKVPTKQPKKKPEKDPWNGRAYTSIPKPSPLKQTFKKVTKTINGIKQMQPKQSEFFYDLKQ